jgi:hypothetical protein
LQVRFTSQAAKYTSLQHALPYPDSPRFVYNCILPYITIVNQKLEKSIVTPEDVDRVWSAVDNAVEVMIAEEKDSE